MKMFCPLGVSPSWKCKNIESRDAWWSTNRRLNCIINKTNEKY